MASQHINTCDHCGTTEQLDTRGGNGWVNFSMHSDAPSFFTSFDMCVACFGDPANLVLVVEKARAKSLAERTVDQQKYREESDARIADGLKRLGYTPRERP